MPDEPTELVPLDDYAPPQLAADDRLRQVWGRWRDALNGAEAADEARPGEGAFDAVPAERLDRIAPRSGLGYVPAMLDRGLGPWVRGEPGPRVRVVVVPPCAPGPVVADCARRHGMEILEPPAAAALISDPEPDPPDLNGTGPLVVPDLGRWFLRHRLGLRHLRGLLDAAAVTDRRVLLGAGGWTWAYLDRVLGAGLVAGDVSTPSAHDARALRDWLVGAAAAADERIRDATDERDVLDPDRANGGRDDPMAKLAARARGIPWVAAAVWRDALRTARPDADGDAGDRARGDRVQDGEALWLVPWQAQVLPPTDREGAALLLHAILIHDGLSPDAIERIVPVRAPLPLIAACLERDLIVRDGEHLRVRAGAYPSVRQALADAGLSLGEP
ncbi:hypothetical protein [Jannaschia sp. LMIT008]|uniref:hypothetical protein n=1 Tax=Jannaschia maritima TaxID=3032585 RepID=UPI002811446C|nr:hypothetical protein [Jannaschia sp. LMIT008]